MPRMAWPSLASRTRPTKLASPPTSLRPRVSDSSSRPTSKSSVWTRTRAISAARDRGKERHLVARLHRRRKVGHLLVHRHAPALSGCERLGPAAIALAQLPDEHRHGRTTRRERELLARA